MLPLSLVVVVPPPAAVVAVIALPIVVVLGMGIAAAEVVRMNEQKTKKQRGEDLPSPSLSPYLSLWLLWSWV